LAYVYSDDEETQYSPGATHEHSANKDTREKGFDDEQSDDEQSDDEYNYLFDSVLPQKFNVYGSNTMSLTQTVGIGEDTNVSASDLGNPSDDFSINTTNNMTIDRINPICFQCKKICIFTELISMKQGRCSNNGNCRSSRKRAHEFYCESCKISVCISCSVSFSAMYDVQNYVRTAKQLTNLCGNNGKFQVSSEIND